MSGMRPSGFACRCVRTKRSPTMRAPWMAPGSFAMTAPSASSYRGAGLARLLGSRGIGRDGIHRGGPLQVADLLLQRADLGLLVRLRRGGELGLREPGGRAGRGLRLRRSARFGLVLVQALTSRFRMRIDWPSERAASGSFFDPNSTMSTTATIRIFHGLSNRSPIMSVPL